MDNFQAQSPDAEALTAESTKALLELYRFTAGADNTKNSFSSTYAKG